MVFREDRGPFQLPIIEHVNIMAMTAWHLDASLVLDESSSDLEDSEVLGLRHLIIETGFNPSCGNCEAMETIAWCVCCQ